ncbi:MAG: discoidin domain-containing protein, partial [Phycisphaerales bacterium]|nr:discoidin domain-containing protein [Phycisphaerales bacterium]
GYHLVLERISHPASMLLGGKAELTLELRNDGCRYPDDPIHVAIARFDQKQNLLDKVWCEGVDLQTNMHPWVSYEQFDTYSGRIVLEQPKTHRASVEIEFPISDTAHELAIGFFSDRSLTQPDIRVGIHGRNENGWYPLEKFGDTPPTNAFPSLHPLSLRKSVMVADSAEGQTGFITDGHAETFWQSPAGAGQWVMIDLGTIQPIDMVMLDWGATFPKGYKIEASANGQNWTSLLRTDNNQGGVCVPQSWTQPAALSSDGLVDR